MCFPDDIGRLEALSERLIGWVNRWVHRRRH